MTEEQEAEREFQSEMYQLDLGGIAPSLNGMLRAMLGGKLLHTIVSANTPGTTFFDLEGPAQVWLISDSRIVQLRYTDSKPVTNGAELTDLDIEVRNLSSIAEFSFSSATRQILQGATSWSGADKDARFRVLPDIRITFMDGAEWSISTKRSGFRKPEAGIAFLLERF